MTRAPCRALCICLVFYGTPVLAGPQQPGVAVAAGVAGHVAGAGDADVRGRSSSQAGRRPLSTFIVSSDATAQGARRLQSPATSGAGSRRYLPLIGAAAGATIMGIAVSREEDFTAAGRAMWIGIGAGAGALVGFLISP